MGISKKRFGFMSQIADIKTIYLEDTRWKKYREKRKLCGKKIYDSP